MAQRMARPQDSFNRKQDALWQAVTAKDLPEVCRLVERDGVDVNFVAPDGWVREAGPGGKSLLHQAAWVGDLEVFKYLVEHGADFCEPRRRNWARAKGFTPFHHACFYNRTKIAAYCIEKGADPNIIGEDGFTPLHLAAKFGYVELARLLIRSGARGNIPNKADKCAWQLANDEDLKLELRKHSTGATAPSAAAATVPAKPTVALNRPWGVQL